MASSLMMRLSLPRSERERIIRLSVAHVQALAQAMPTRSTTMVITYAGLGLRIAEAWAYRHSTAVKQAVAQLGAKHKFIKPHCPWQKARSSGSTARYRPKGPTGRSSSATPTVPPRLPPGWSSTTLDADTPHLAASRQPADCHQPCDRVQLGRGAWTLRGLSCPPRSTPARASPLIPVRRPQYSTRPRCRVSPLSFCKAGIDHIGVWTADLGATVIALAVADLLRAAGVTVAP